MRFRAVVSSVPRPWPKRCTVPPPSSFTANSSWVPRESEMQAQPGRRNARIAA
jgi:hypothetical protein